MSSAAIALTVLGRTRAKIQAGEKSIMAALAAASPSGKSVDINRGGAFDSLRDALGASSADQLEWWASIANPRQIADLFDRAEAALSVITGPAE